MKFTKVGAVACVIGLLLIGAFSEPVDTSIGNSEIIVESNVESKIESTISKVESSDAIDNKEDFSEVVANALADIPEYSSKAYVVINNNTPFFDEADLTTASYEKYSELDDIGRCGVVIASIGKDIMPTEERGYIGSVKPTGWHTTKYQGIDGNYLYNRCHLIGYQLTGENANERNLITGTRYMNVQGMLPFENMVADYVKETNNHVLYRVTPIFHENNLVASGVLMEAKSVEDNGDGILFNVYCYNVQPGIKIDYQTGESTGPEYAGNTGNTTVATTPVVQTPNKEEVTETNETKKEVTYILNKNSSSMKIHYPDCSSVQRMSEKNKVYFTGTLQEAINMGYTSCGNCNP